MMDARQVRFWIAAFAITAINVTLWISSHRGGELSGLVRVAHASTGDELAETGRLSLRFDREVYGDEQLQKAITDPPFRIDPPLEGEWVVRSSDEVAFEPRIQPRDGHLYRVEMVEGHRFFDLVRLDPDGMPEVAYRPLELKHAKLLTTRSGEPMDDKPARLATVELLFNQPVSPDELRDHLEVETIGKTRSLDFVEEGAASRFRFEVPVRPGGHVHLNLDSGLTGMDGELGLAKDHVQRIGIPKGFGPSWASGEPRGYWSSGAPSIRLGFDRRLNAGQNMPKITVTPEVTGLQARIRYSTIMLTGGFKHEQTYTVRVESPLVAHDGAIMDQSFQRTVRIPRPAPSLSFPEYRGRISSTGAFEVDLQHCGVDEMHLEVHRLLPRHLPVYLSGIMSDGEVPQLAERLVSRPVQLERSATEFVDAALDLEQYMPRENGIYHLSVRADGNRWVRDEMLVLVGQLGIEVQADAEGMLAWVTDVPSGEPVAGARVVAWADNRTELAEGVTDADGLIRFDVKSESCDLMTAHAGNDVVFVEPRDARGLDDRALAGAAWPGPLEVVLYADRGIHRPGETIQLSGAVRSSTGDVIRDVPLEIRFTRPDKRVMIESMVQTDAEQGLFHFELPTRADDPTGNWLASVHVPGEDDAIATLACPVMPFLPVRLAIDSIMRAPEKEGDLLEVDVMARYLHGAPASGLQVNNRVSYVPVRYTNADHPDHTFEEIGTRRKVRRNGKGHTDETGLATFAVEGPGLAGTWKAHAESTVMELGGRPTTSHASVMVDTAPVHIGGRIVGGLLHRPDDVVTVDVVRIDRDGQRQLSGVVHGRVLGVDHEWQLHSGSDGVRNWRSVEVTRPVRNLDLTFEVTPEGHWACEVPPLAPGAYRFIASIPENDALAEGETPYVQLDFHVSNGPAIGRMAASRTDRLELVLEHPEAQPGMESSVLIRTPFPGKALLTVETDRILATHVIDVTGDGVRVPFTIPASARDTCFVGATLIRPLDATRTAWLPLEARGAARVRIDRTPHELPMQMSSSDAARPGEVVNLMVSVPGAVREEAEASAPAMIHVWAVEEGALLVTDHRVPNLVDGFFRDRRRMVNAISTVNDLLPDYQRPETMARIGGDGRGRFREPVAIRQPDIAVLWQHSQPLPADGLMDLELTMPDIDGAMRIMAVVVDGDRYGQSEHLVGVVPPIQLVAAFPRAAAPNDLMKVPVQVRNNTAAPQEIELDLELQEGLEGALPSPSMTLEPGAEEVFVLELVAGRPGTIPVEIRADVADVDIDPVRFIRHVAVRPPHGREREVRRMYLEGGTTTEIERNRSLDELAGRIEITVGGNPDIELKSTLDDLIDYPYGCGEQTGSRTQGLLAVMQLDASITGYDPSDISSMADAGINRLWWLQNADGGMPYWRGGESSPWMTIRTALIALDAREREMKLPEGFLEGLLDHIESRIRSDKKWVASTQAQAMACRVLARSGRPDEAVMASLSTNVEALDIQSRAHLADAHHAVGNLEEWDRITAMFVVPKHQPPSTSGWFGSDVTQAAVALGVLLRNMDEHPMMPEYARYLADARTDRGWRNTFENAQAIDAMVRWNARQTQRGTARGTINIAGRSIEFAGNDPIRHVIDVDRSASAAVESVVSDGDGMVSVLIQSSGVPMDAIDAEPVDHVLRVQRRFMDADGTPLDEDLRLEAGDLVIVELQVQSMTSMTHHNVAILDVLPGGMEFELPTLATSARGDAQKLSEVDNVEFRDDRMIAFASVGTKPVRIQYLARAVVPGRWAVPAPDALSMYEADVHGRGLGGALEIALP